MGRGLNLQEFYLIFNREAIWEVSIDVHYSAKGGKAWE
jgi:hypothetical protein